MCRLGARSGVHPRPPPRKKYCSLEMTCFDEFRAVVFQNLGRKICVNSAALAPMPPRVAMRWVNRDCIFVVTTI